MIKKILLFILLGIFLISFASAIESNITKQDAELCINQSRIIISNLQNDGFSIIRVNDTLNEANLFYQSQKSSRTAKISFSRVIDYCNEIKNISEQAYTARDSFQALITFYNQSITEDMNTTDLDALISQIDDEIKSERYEKVEDLVNRGYDKISQVQSEFSTINVIYMNTTKSLKIFFQKNWLTIAVLIILFLIFFLAYKTRIKHWLVERKIKNLEIRKSTIKTLITKIQTDYFHTGSISEGEYNVKTKKFAELIRDIDRQIPLLYEERAKTEEKFKKAIKLNSSDKLSKPIKVVKLDKK